MVDLALNDNGDLVFIEESFDLKNKLNLKFIISKSDSLRLNFYINNIAKIKNNHNTLKLNFEINIPTYNKICETISDEEALEQAIKLRISTSLNSVKGNKEMGSSIEEFKHQNISEEKLFERLSNEISRCLEDILPNNRVTVSKYKTYYREFQNALKVTVIDRGKYFYYYL